MGAVLNRNPRFALEKPAIAAATIGLTATVVAFLPKKAIGFQQYDAYRSLLFLGDSLKYFRMTFRDTQKGSRSAPRRASSLFPILYGINRNIEKLREFLLSEIDGLPRGNSEQLFGRIDPPLFSSLHLLDGLKQLIALGTHVLFPSHGQLPL